MTVIPSPLNGFQNAGTVFLGCHFLNGITAVSGVVIVIGNGLSVVSKCVGIASLRAYHINVITHLFQVVVHILSISTRSPITVCDGIAQRQNFDCLLIFSSCRCSRNCANCQRGESGYSCDECSQPLFLSIHMFHPFLSFPPKIRRFFYSFFEFPSIFSIRPFDKKVNPLREVLQFHCTFYERIVHFIYKELFFLYKNGGI